MAQAIHFDELANTLLRRGAGRRSITAIAGPPASGKSTLAERLARQLNDAAAGSAAVLAMDGYHFDDLVLVQRGMRSRKGAPDTFDAAGLRHMLCRLKQNEEVEIAVPVFDRGLEIARAGALLIPRSVRHLIVEGNYLLLDRTPWSDLLPYFDTTVMSVVPETILRQRLTARWQGYGLSPSEIATKIDGNDLPNGRVVTGESVAAEFALTED